MTAFGSVLGFAALAFLGGEPWLRGFGQLLGGLICGIPFGAVVGLSWAIYWIRARYESEAWNVIVWLAILLGCLTGAVIRFGWRMPDKISWIGTAVFVIACGTMG
jgi:hypothetical protein